jgi:hypothetical protein
MGEEAFDDVLIALPEGMHLHVRGGYDRSVVYLVLERQGFADRGWPDIDVCVSLDREECHDLRRALRVVLQGKP